MSRTDKTKPWLVRVAEHRPRANHDHIDGVCDLPDDPRTGHDWSQAHACYWSDWNLYYDGCCHGCGCPMCSDSLGRRTKRRRSRHQARSHIKAGRWDRL